MERKDCRCYVAEKLGGRILEDVLAWLRDAIGRCPGDAARLLGIEKDAKILDLANEIIAWGCALPEMAL